MFRWLLTIFLALVVFSAMLPWLEKLGVGRLPGDLRFRIFGRTFFFAVRIHHCGVARHFSFCAIYLKINHDSLGCCNFHINQYLLSAFAFSWACGCGPVARGCAVSVERRGVMPAFWLDLAVVGHRLCDR